jgi:hypothetical protein
MALTTDRDKLNAAGKEEGAAQSAKTAQFVQLPGVASLMAGIRGELEVALQSAGVLHTSELGAPSQEPAQTRPPAQQASQPFGVQQVQGHFDQHDVAGANAHGPQATTGKQPAKDLTQQTL